MIGLLKGKIEKGYLNNIIVNVNGVGYEVRVPSSQMEKILSLKETLLYIHTHVRDDAFELFGFLQKEDLRIFKLLLNVSGVGPRLALNILSAGVEGVKKAVIESDTVFFSNIPKIGGKNAQKIIIELKSKLGSISELDLSQKENKELVEIVDVLRSMGFSQKEAYNTVRKLPKEAVTLEDKIRLSLKILK